MHLQPHACGRTTTSPRATSRLTAMRAPRMDGTWSTGRRGTMLSGRMRRAASRRASRSLSGESAARHLCLRCLLTARHLGSVRPLNPLSINDENAWEATHNSLRVMDGMGKRGGREDWVFGTRRACFFSCCCLSAPTLTWSFPLDNVVSGSDNKEIYDTAARDHVRYAAFHNPRRPNAQLTQFCLAARPWRATTPSFLPTDRLREYMSHIDLHPCV